MCWGALLHPKDAPIWARDCTSTAACVTSGPICARPFPAAAVLEFIIESLFAADWSVALAAR